MSASPQLRRQQFDSGDGTHVIVLIGPGPDRRPACLEHDPELFFATAPADQERAKAICAGCPRRSDCLDEALATDPAGKPWGQFGVWGGLSAEERETPQPAKKLGRRGGRTRRRAA